MDEVVDLPLLQQASDENGKVGGAHHHVQQQQNELLHQEAFDKLYGHPHDSTSLKQRLFGKLRSCCSKRAVLGAIAKLLPVICLVRTYKFKEYFLPDVLAGLSVSILHLSQGLGYSVLCGLPPVYGIYVSFFHPLLYFFFGTSRHLSVGTFSLTSLLVSTVIQRETAALAGAALAKPSAVPLPLLSNGSGGPLSYAFENSTAAYNASSVSADGQPTQDGLPLTNGSGGLEDDLTAAKVELAVCLSLLIGIFQLIMGVCRFGFITSYLSPAFVGGFTCAAAFHIANSQLRFAAFGRQNYIRSASGAFKFFKIWYEFFTNITKGNWLCGVCFLVSAAILLAVKQGINKNPRLRHKLRVPVPVDFVVVVVGTILSRFLHFESIPTEANGVPIIGVIPWGLPAPSLPLLSRASGVVGDAFIIAVISYLFNYSMSNFFEEKYKYATDDNQELVATGLLHIVSSFFSCFPGAASPPRCFMQDSSGCRTQVCGLVSSVVMLIVLYAVGPYLYWLPFPIIAALIVVSIKRLVLQLRDLRQLIRQDKIDFVVWILTFVLTIVLDVDTGMLAGIAVSLVAIAVRMQLKTPHVAGELHSVFESHRHYAVTVMDDIVVLRYEAPILYPNADRFRKMVLQAAKEHFEVAEQRSGVPAVANGNDPAPVCTCRAVVIDCSFISCIDVAGLRSLRKLHKALLCNDMSLLLASCSLSLRNSLRCATPELYQLAFLSVKAAITAARQNTSLTPDKQMART